MPQILARPSIGFDTARVPVQKTSVVTLSTGHTVTAVCDPNMPSMSGGTGTGAHTIYVTMMSPGQTSGSSVLVTSFSFANFASTATTGAIGIMSMSVDSANNIHMVYAEYFTTTASMAVRYRKLTWTGTTFTLGSAETVQSAVANKYVQALDIDIASNSVVNPTIVVVNRTGTNPYVQNTEVIHRSTAGSWLLQSVRNYTGLFNYPDVAISLANDTGLTTAQWVVALNPGPPSAGWTDRGDFIYSGRVTVATGHVGGSLVTMGQSLNIGLNGGFRTPAVYYLTNNTFVVHFQARSAPSQEWIGIYTKSLTDNTWSVVGSPVRVDTSTATYARYTRKTTASSIIKTSSTTWVLEVYNVSASAVWITTHEVANTTGTWRISSTRAFKPYSSGYAVKSTFLVPWAGDRGRFTAYNSPTVMTPHTRNNAQTIVQRLYAWTRPPAPVVSVASPTANQLVSTSTPITTINVTGVGVDAGKMRSRVQQQLSPVSDFSSGVVDRTQLVSEEAYFGPTVSPVKVSQVGFPVSQGIWYIRARSLDQFGGIGAWSASIKFTVSHPPRPYQMSPANNTVLVYNAGGTIFSWKFSDAYASDRQTAYQVDVYDEAGVLAVSTGKVTSPVNSAAVVIPSALLETRITYYVTLYDMDDVAGAPTLGGTVWLTTPPVPAITFPTADGEIITTGTPAITWTSGVTGTKFQYTYRVQIRRFSDNFLVYDSGSVFSMDEFLNLPSGKLRNDITYAIVLSITDSANLQGVVTRYFNTAWVAPLDMQSPFASMDFYDKYGFIAVEVDALTGKDADNISTNLYRRPLDFNAEWTLIDTRTDPADNYTFWDYTCPANVTVEYLVTQVVDRFGETMESSLLSSNRHQVALESASYWLVDLDDPKGTLRVPTVTSDSYNKEIEETTYTVANRGRVVEIGETLGVTGTLSAQFRDHEAGWKLRDNYNLTPNPNIEYNSQAILDQWEIFQTGTTNNQTFSEINTQPGPTARSKQLMMSVEKTTVTSSNFTAGIRCVVNAGPYLRTETRFPPHMFSFWCRIEGYNPNYRITPKIEIRNGNTILDTTTTDIDVGGKIDIWNSGYNLQSASYRGAHPSGAGTHEWVRFGIQTGNLVLGTPFDNVCLTISIKSVGSTALPQIRLFMEGCMFHSVYDFSNTYTARRANAISYFDGDTPGALWTNVPRIHPSYNPGALTARWIKKKLEQAKESNHRLVLRTPFGDNWPVHLSGLSVSRVAGVGSNEFVDVEIPYLEVAD